VEVWSSYSFEHVMLIHNVFHNNNEEFYLLNVYAPCDGVAKQLLWVTLSMRIKESTGKNIVSGGISTQCGV